MKLLVVLLAVMAFAACSRKPETPVAEKTSPMGPAPELSQPVIDMNTMSPEKEDPSTVLVEVNGKKLTAGEVDMEVKMQMTGVAGNVPPGYETSLRNKSVSEFIVRALLLAEADKQNIAATEADMKEVLDELSRKLPPGKDIEEVIKTSPIGEEKMREQINMGIRINKLLKSVTASHTNISDQEVTDFIEKNKNDLPETVTAKHILIMVNKADDDKAKEEKKKKAEDIRKKLLDGGDFDALAKQYSDDLRTRGTGGNLGTFPRDRMDPDFVKAAFSQELNKAGSIVETRFGYHIILVTAHYDAGTAPRDEVAVSLRNARIRNILDDYIKDLGKKADIKDYRKKDRQPVMTAPRAVTPDAAN